MADSYWKRIWKSFTRRAEEKRAPSKVTARIEQKPVPDPERKQQTQPTLLERDASSSRPDSDSSMHADSPAPASPTISGRSAGQPSRTEKARQERTVIVGVDFGTSSVKVAWQLLPGQYFEIFRWNSNSKGLGSILLPSTIGLAGDAIHFAEHDRNQFEIWLPSVKLCILCRANNSICRCDGNAQHGVVNVIGAQPQISSTAFAALFLAFVFNTVERDLRAKFPTDEVFFIWNVGCPMDHIDSSGSKGIWEKMVGVGMALRHRISNPTTLALANEASRLLASITIPPEEVRNYFIQPEGLAAVKAFLEAPRGPEQKSYAIVDVGAGTTEVSFFFNGHKPSYLADSTEAVGGGAIDADLAEKWGCDVNQARARKEAATEHVPMLASVERICTQYVRTCMTILREHRLTARNDKRFDLFVIGGGGRLALISEKLAARALPGHFVLEKRQKLKPPATLRNATDLLEDYDLLANACGLASSLDWEYYPPHEVPPMAAAAAANSRPDRDELYPK